MALEVEDGTGKTNAESYLSVTDCDTYHTNHGDSSDWSGATTAEKEEALRMATQYIDIEYGPRWKGYRANDDQALAWPRYDVTDNDGYAVDSDDIPARLEDATAEAALRHITETNGLIPDISEPGTIKEYSVKAGPVAKKTVYEGGRSQVVWFRKLDALLYPLLHPYGWVERG